MDLKTIPSLLDGKYLLRDKIGSGSFGQLYSAINKETNAMVAIKIEKKSSNGNPVLQKEAKVLSELRGEPGFSTNFHFGRTTSINYLVMDLFGQDLEKLRKNSSHGFSLKTVLMLADQMLSRIEALHSKGYIHRDIKPENFCMTKDLKEELCLIDFGLARSIYDENGKHIKCVEKKGLIGTARYASVHSHLGLEQSRRDDLESLGYVLIYLLKGKLPWQKVNAFTRIEKYEKIAQKKMEIPMSKLCHGLPGEFAVYMNYVRGLDFEQTPDYTHLKGLFRTLFLRNGYEFDHVYNWLGVKQREILQALHRGTGGQNPTNHNHFPKRQSCFVVSTTAQQTKIQHKGLNQPDEITKKEEEVPDVKVHHDSTASLVIDTKDLDNPSYRLIINAPENTGTVELKDFLIHKKRFSLEAYGEIGTKGLLTTANSNKMDTITSENSSKLLNLSSGKVAEEEDDIPAEMNVVHSPSFVMQKTQPMHTKSKDSYYFDSQNNIRSLPLDSARSLVMRKRTFLNVIASPRQILQSEVPTSQKSIEGQSWSKNDSDLSHSSSKGGNFNRIFQVFLIIYRRESE